MDKFHMGQKVRILPDPNGKFPETDYVIYFIITHKFWDDEFLEYMYGVSIGYDISEDLLEPVYDGDEQSSWEEGAWKPKDLAKPKEKAEQN